MRYIIALFLILLFSQDTKAENPNFRVFINGTPYTVDSEFTPCYPLHASFEHDDLRVTKIRNEYPIDTSKYFMYSLHDRPHLEFHEDNMKKNLNPYMDWVAEDYEGNEYGRIRMMFYAPPDQRNNDCNDFTS